MPDACHSSCLTVPDGVSRKRPRFLSNACECHLFGQIKRDIERGDEEARGWKRIACMHQDTTCVLRLVQTCFTGSYMRVNWSDLM